MYKYILFDLDGTIIDPFEGITKSVQYALKKYNIEVADRTILKKFIGPPLIDSFQEYYNFTKDKALESVEYYREYFKEKGIFECVLYKDIKSLLIELKKMNKKIIIATSKPEAFSIQILEKFEILKYFDFVAGATFDHTRSKKGDIIKYALNSLNIDKDKAVMVGDRKHDIQGAKENNIDSIGVSFGYGSIEELKDAGANYIVNNPLEILKIVK